MTTKRPLSEDKNRADHKDFDRHLNFADSRTLAAATQQREDLLFRLDGAVEWGYNGTKADCRNLSPGCRHCGNGTWSCLFINNLCNAGCFYCPTPQKSKDEPTTQTVSFSDPDDYIAYLKKFGYKGVSISGGEPLLTFNRTLDFIRRIHEEMGSEVYLWMYTNGMLLDEDKLRLLRQAGLDEIRLDIGATAYRTDKVELALKWIDTVTVEIPAVPEELDRLKKLMHCFSDMGLHHLNLHQIRCTPHNHSKLSEHGYTFLHGKQITVLESELAALQLMAYAADQGLNLPVNYCSSTYKYRYQRMAARRRFAPFIAHSYEETTDTGLIRSMAVEGPSDRIDGLQESLRKAEIPRDDCYRPEGTNKLYFKKYLWHHVQPRNWILKISYARAFLLPSVSYRNMFKEVDLDGRRKVVIERTPVVHDHSLRGEAIQWFEEVFVKGLPKLTERQQNSGEQSLDSGHMRKGCLYENGKSRSISPADDGSKLLGCPQSHSPGGALEVSAAERSESSGLSREMAARICECEQLGQGLPPYL